MRFVIVLIISADSVVSSLSLAYGPSVSDYIDEAYRHSVIQYISDQLCMCCGRRLEQLAQLWQRYRAMHAPVEYGNLKGWVDHFVAK